MKHIENYNRHINKFLNQDPNIDNSKNWHNLMTAYHKLCKKLPFVPFNIIGTQVYQNGLIDTDFQEAMFIAIGTACEKYNNRKYFIKYE